MLCGLCSSIDFFKANVDPGESWTLGAPRRGFKHHPSTSALYQSAESGCELCHMLSRLTKLSRQEAERFDSGRKNNQIYCILKTSMIGGFCGNLNGTTAQPSLYKGRSILSFEMDCVDESNISSSWKCQVGVYCEEDSVPANLNIISGRSIVPSDSEEAILLAQRWIKTCLDDHRDSCPVTPLSALPTRIIDIGNESDRQPFLYVTEGACAPYVTLSHCWGSSKPRFITTSDTLADRQRFISLDDVPQTFRDAIGITRRLGYQYLWIDSLCILQDSHNDWAAESALMGDYYKKSIVTIMAEAAVSDEMGFLQSDSRGIEGKQTPKAESIEDIRIPFYVPLHLRIFNKHQEETQVSVDESLAMQRNLRMLYDDEYVPSQVCVRRPTDRSAATPATQKRGWILQEHVLSPRTLYYRGDQIAWECQRYRVYEDDATPEITEFDLDDSTKRFFLTGSESQSAKYLAAYAQDMEFHYRDNLFKPCYRWYKIVEDFMNRKLTYPSDRFPAISGIAREVAKQTGYSYIAGLWKEDIQNGLLWWTHGDAVVLDEYRAPSWSWASLEVPGGLNGLYSTFMSFFVVENPPALGSVEVISAHIETADGDLYGRVKSGFLELRGPWISVTDVKHALGTNIVHYVGVDNEMTYISLDCQPAMRSGSRDTYKPNVSKLSLLRIGRANQLGCEFTWYAMILEAAEDDSGDEIYRRVGLTAISKADQEASDGWTTKKVVII